MKKHTEFRPSSMGFTDAFSIGIMKPSKYPEHYMKLDLQKAKQIIRDRLKVKGIKYAEVGLEGDWHENSQKIYVHDVMDNNDEVNIWDNSRWAVPMLLIAYKDGTMEGYDCYTKVKKDEN